MHPNPDKQGTAASILPAVQQPGFLKTHTSCVPTPSQPLSPIHKPAEILRITHNPRREGACTSSHNANSHAI